MRTHTFIEVIVDAPINSRTGAVEPSLVASETKWLYSTQKEEDAVTVREYFSLRAHQTGAKVQDSARPDPREKIAQIMAIDETLCPVEFLNVKVGDTFPARQLSSRLGYTKFNQITVALSKAKQNNETTATTRGVTYQYVN